MSVCLSSGCSRTFEQESGYLKSPGWPEVYPHDLDCVTLLKAPQNSTISLFFSSFDVESHPSCQYDYLEVSVDTSASPRSHVESCRWWHGQQWARCGQSPAAHPRSQLGGRGHLLCSLSIFHVSTNMVVM